MVVSLRLDKEKVCKFVRKFCSMKKLMLICVVVFLSSEISLAQVFHGGVKGGVGASQVSGDRLAGFDKAGLFGGLFAGISLSDHSEIHLEMLYVQKGSRQNAKPDKGIYSSYVLRLNYIELPLMYTWRGNDYFELEGGLSYGYLMKNTDVEWDENGLLPATNPFRKYEISIQLGMNYILNDQMKVNFRLNNSLLPIREHAGGATYLLNLGQYNTLLMLGLRYQL
jgi:hypothetical protein